MYIINEKTLTEFDIGAVEEKYNAKYMGVWCLKTKYNGWAQTPSAIFHVENPDRSLGHTNYFGLFSRNGATYITKGNSAFGDSLYGVVAEDGEVIISRYCDDYAKSKDGTVWISGGRDYSCHSNSTMLTAITIMGSEFHACCEKIELRSK